MTETEKPKKRKWWQKVGRFFAKSKDFVVKWAPIIVDTIRDFKEKNTKKK